MLDRKHNSGGQRQTWAVLRLGTDLRNVGEAMSGYLDPGCLRPDCPVEPEVGLDFGEVDSPAAFSCSWVFSVWLMVMGLQRSEPTLLPSLRLWPVPGANAAPPDFPLTLESMLLELERWLLRATTPLEDLAGRGRERYCRDTLELSQLIRTVSSWGWEPSRLVLRTPTTPVPFPGAAEDLGAFPSVAEPLDSVAPLEVIRAPLGPGSFLNPNEVAVGGRAMPEGGFLPSSPLLFPASEGERWIPEELLEDALPFSEAFASSVLPVDVNRHWLTQNISFRSFWAHYLFSTSAAATKTKSVYKQLDSQNRTETKLLFIQTVEKAALCKIVYHRKYHFMFSEVFNQVEITLFPIVCLEKWMFKTP